MKQKVFSTHTHKITDVYISLKDAVVPNNGYVAIRDIGSTDNSALICHTNRPSNGAHSGGDWYGPNGKKVDYSTGTSVPGFVRNRAPMIVRLKRFYFGSPSNGIYYCDVNDSMNTSHTVYVGVYDSEPESGKPQQYCMQVHKLISCITFIGSLEILKLTLNSRQIEGSPFLFNLTCMSTGGPPTNVMWTREADILTELTSSVLIHMLTNAMIAEYVHTLTVPGRFGGLYTCTVRNIKSTSSANITVQGKHNGIPFVVCHDNMHNS